MLIRVVVEEELKPVQNAQVSIYESYEDWLNFENDVATGLTNNFGEIQFDNLSGIQYYIHVYYVDSEKNAYTNFPLGIFASSVLHSGERAVLTVGVYDVDKLVDDEYDDEYDEEELDNNGGGSE
jgi:hypothetical protein